MTTLAGRFKHPPTPPAIPGNFVPLPSSDEVIQHKRLRELQLVAPPITSAEWNRVPAWCRHCKTVHTQAVPAASLEDAA